MKKLSQIVDSCTIKYNIQKRDYAGFRKTYILPFQLDELTGDESNCYFRTGGRLLRIRSKYRGDTNFYVLDPLVYSIVTHDKKLKRKLKRLRFTTYNNIYLGPGL
jgi:hypothetical protein